MTHWYDRGTSNKFGNRKKSIVVEYIIGELQNLDWTLDWSLDWTGLDSGLD